LRCRERSQCRGIPSGGRHSGFRESVALRGAAQERRPRSAHESEGSIQPFERRVDDQKGCSGRSKPEKGNLRSCRTAAAVGVRDGPLLGATRPARSSACHSTAIDAIGGRVEAPPASGAEADWWFSGSTLPARLQRRRGSFGRTDAARGSRCLSSKGEGRRSVIDQRRREQLRSSAEVGNLEDDARIGCSRVCPYVGM